MVEFGGWEMPIQYTSVVEEHRAVRTAVGLTDVSHMGRLIFEGPGAGAFLDSLLSRDVSALKPGQVRYSLLTDQRGGIIDDVLIGCFAKPGESADSMRAGSIQAGSVRYVLVVNASNRKKVLEWIRRYLADSVARKPDEEVLFADTTTETAMIAIQGPKAVALMQSHVENAQVENAQVEDAQVEDAQVEDAQVEDAQVEDAQVEFDLASMKYYNGAYIRLKSDLGVEGPVLLTRTGYTGEDGFELTVPAGSAEHVWDTLHASGRSAAPSLLPVGLGARDTLRLEAGMPLYGHEMNEETDPFEAGLSYACCLDGTDYPGRDALVALSGAALKRVRVGIMLDEKRPAREGCSILIESGQNAFDQNASGVESGRTVPRPVGVVSSGSFSPTLGRPVAMGFVPPEYSSPGQLVLIDIRGRMASGKVVPLPFYKRK